MKTINDGTAIHDQGYQFFLLLNFKREINKSIKELIGIEECIKYHIETKAKKDCEWYNSKTKLTCWGPIKGYPTNSNKFTSREINAIYKDTKNKYDFLIGIAKESLSDIKKSENQHWRLPYGDANREDILIDHTDIDDFI